MNIPFWDKSAKQGPLHSPVQGLGTQEHGKMVMPLVGAKNVIIRDPRADLRGQMAWGSVGLHNS